MQFIELYHIYFEMLSLIITSTLAVLTFIFLVRQHKLQEINLRLAAYDRRLKVYNVIKSFLTDITARGIKISDGKIGILVNETSEIKFLFDDKKIPKFIDELTKRGFELRNIQSQMGGPIVADIEADEAGRQIAIIKHNEEQEELRKQEYQKINWFLEQHKVLDGLFNKYLNLGK